MKCFLRIANYRIIFFVWICHCLLLLPKTFIWCWFWEMFYMRTSSLFIFSMKSISRRLVDFFSFVWKKFISSVFKERNFFKCQAFHAFHFSVSAHGQALLNWTMHFVVIREDALAHPRLAFISIRHSTSLVSLIHGVVTRNSFFNVLFVSGVNHGREGNSFLFFFFKCSAWRLIWKMMTILVSYFLKKKF